MIYSSFKSLTIAFIFLFIGTNLHSQTGEIKNREKAIYDSLTYYYYNIQNWDSVIDIGKEALYKGYDFYYLRMRMGIAYDYEGNFRYAEKHYAEALKIVPADINAAYYYYYAAVNGGRKSVANKNYLAYTTAQKSSIKKLDKIPADDIKNTDLEQIDIKALEQVYFEYGYSFTGNKDKLPELFPQHMHILYSEGLVRNVQNYIYLSLNGNLSPFIRWKFDFTNNIIDGYNLIQPRTDSYFTAPSSVNQTSFYGKIGFYSGDGWNIKMSGQTLDYESKFTDFYADSISYSVPETQGDTILLESVHFAEEDIRFKNNDLAFELSINKKVGLVDLSLFGSYANINRLRPFQLGGSLTLLPAGNYSVYLTNRLFYYHDDLSDRSIYKIIAGANITKNLNIEGAVTFGDLKNTIEPNSSIVYNWSEKTSFKGEMVISYQFTPNLNASLRYQLTQKRGLYHYYSQGQLYPSADHNGYYYASYNEEFDEFKFNQHFIIVGLSWVF